MHNHIPLKLILDISNSITDDPESSHYRLYRLMESVGIDPSDELAYDDLYSELLSVQEFMIDISKVDESDHYIDEDEITIMDALDKLIESIEELTTTTKF